MATAPILRYALTTDPFPLQASPQSGNLTTATLTIVASNPTSAPVTLQGLIVTLPVGDGSTDLTPDAASISPIPPANWTLNDTVPSTGQVKYIFYPAKGHGAVGSEGLNFVFNTVEINRQTGTVAVEIMEGSNDCTPPNCPTKTLDLTKFPHGWGEVSFWAHKTHIPYDTSPTLYWNGPQGATYTIDYYTQQTGVVTVPSIGQPPLSNSGQYPGTNAPPLRLEQTTPFTLNVEERIDNQPYQAQQQVTVTVRVPPPKIISFTADPTKIQSGQRTPVTLKWRAQNTNRLDIGNVGVFKNETAGKGQTITYPDTATTYVATAYGLAGYTGQPATAQAKVTPTPQITKFTGEIQTSNSTEVSLVLNWEVLYVTECKISGISETSLPPIGSKTITPSVEHPLQTTYTLTATNVAGSATSELTVVWGKQALTTTTTLLTPMGVAVFPDGTLVFVVNSDNSTVSVFDATTLQPAAEPFVEGPIEVGKAPWGIAISSHVAGWPFGSRVFVTNQATNTLSVLLTGRTDPPKIRRYANAPVGTNPSGVAVSPDGKRVFVANSRANTLSVLDVESLLPVTGTPIPVGSQPLGVAVLPDGSRVFVTNYGWNTVSVFDVTADPIKIIGKPIPIGIYPAGLVVSPDGSRVFVANTGNDTVSVLDATTDPITVIGKPIKVGANPLALAITPDGARIFVIGAGGNTITVLNATSDPISVVKPSFKVGEGGFFYSVAMSPDGAHLFVGNKFRNIVSMVIPTSVTGGTGS